MWDQDLEELQAAEEKYLNINQMGLCLLNRIDQMGFRAAFIFYPDILGHRIYQLLSKGCEW